MSQTQLKTKRGLLARLKACVKGVALAAAFCLPAVTHGAQWKGDILATIKENAKNKGSEVSSSPYATGGDLILQMNDGSYVHVFSSTAAAANFAVGSSSDLEGQVIVVGGGGGGGMGQCENFSACGGAGGGGGAVVWEKDVGFPKGTSYAVTIGAGGQHSTALSSAGGNGGESSFIGEGNTFKAPGGGGGGSGGLNASTESMNGGSGASGGGAGGKGTKTAQTDRTYSGYVSGTRGLASKGRPGGTAGYSMEAKRNSGEMFLVVAAGGGGGASAEGAAGVHAHKSGTFVSGGAGINIGDIVDNGVLGQMWAGDGGAAGAACKSLNQKLVSGEDVPLADSIYRIRSGGNATAGDNPTESGKNGLGGGGAGANADHEGSTGDCLGGDGGSGVVIVRYKTTGSLCAHNWVKDPSGSSQDKTCTVDGFEDQYCTECNKKRRYVDAATGHVWDETKSPKECSVCHALEECTTHTWLDDHVVTPATCTEGGETVQKCSVCRNTRSVATPALGHDWGTPVVTKEPTCTEAGTGTHTCQRAGCGVSESTTIPKLGHLYGDWVVKTAATCTDEGYQERTCTRNVGGKVCGAIEKGTIAPLGHDFDETTGECTRCHITEAKSKLAEDIRAVLAAGLAGDVQEVKSSPYAAGGDMIIKVKDNEYIHIFSDPAAAKSFTVNGNFNLLSRLLVVGGGGGGSTGKFEAWNYASGGGGGGGAVKSAEDVWLKSGVTYAVTVGAGGAVGGAGVVNKTVAGGGTTENTDVTHKRPENGGTTTFSGGAVSMTALGGGAGGMATPWADGRNGQSAATGGGAAGWLNNYDKQIGAPTCSLGTPGTGSAGGKGGNAVGFFRSEGKYGWAVGGGGGGAGSGNAANGADGTAYRDGGNKGQTVQSGGEGVHSDILGYDLGFGGGGAGGALAAGQGNGIERHLAIDGGASSIDSGAIKETLEEGWSGYGGGGAGRPMNGNQGSVGMINSGTKGGSGVVIIRYLELGIDETNPLLTFQDATPEADETTLDIAWKLRNCGSGCTTADLYVEYGRTDGKEPQKATATIKTGATAGETGVYQLKNLKPGRPYTFKIYAKNKNSKTTYSDETFDLTMPGGQTAWATAVAMQSTENKYLVDFVASIGYVGEGTSTVKFRYNDGTWHEETLGTFSRQSPPPSEFRVQKRFLEFKTIDYEFIVTNNGEGGDITWTDTRTGKIALTDGLLTQAYWETKQINIAPVRQSTSSSEGRRYDVYTHEQDPLWGDSYTGLDTFQLVTPEGGDAEGRPLVVSLHGRGSTWTSYGPGEDGVTYTPSDAYAVSFDNDRGGGKSVNRSYPYWWGATGIWGGPEKEYIASYRNETPTAKRVLDCIEWIVRTKKIDRNRIYIVGNSMGGQGALAIGLPHGEVFAAIEANVPATVWYYSARMNFVDDKGNVREESDRDASLYNDPPPVLDWSGSEDIWSRDHEVFQTAMNRFRYAYVGLWGFFLTSGDMIGHEWDCANARKYNDLVGRWLWRFIEKNKAYPVFTNAKEGPGEVNDIPPWPWADVAYGRETSLHEIYQYYPIEGKKPTYVPTMSTMTFADNVTTNGQRNFFFRWENKSDTASGVSMDLWIANKDEAQTQMFNPPASATVDVTLRRIQGFKLRPNQKVSWTFGSASGTATADKDGLVTLPLTLKRDAHQTLTLTPGDFDTLTAEANILEVKERQIDVIANLVGGASTANLSIDYTPKGGTTQTKNVGTVGKGANAYELTGLTPDTEYAIVVHVGSVAIDLGKVTTKYYPLAAEAELVSIGATSATFKWRVNARGTTAANATVSYKYREENASTWTEVTSGQVTADSGEGVVTINGLQTASRYFITVSFKNGVDAGVYVDLEAMTTYDATKRLVEVPAIPDLIFNGSLQKPTVVGTDDYDVTANAGGTNVGEYTVTLKLKDATTTAWVGFSGDTATAKYKIVSGVANVTIPAGAKVRTYTRKGDTYIIFDEGTDIAFNLKYDARADILLVGGGGAGGLASDWNGYCSRPTMDYSDGVHKGGVGAGGGAGGMLEYNGVYLYGGDYKVTVGEGAEPVTTLNTRGERGGSSTFTGGGHSFSVYGGGSGGSAANKNLVDGGQKSASMGVKGGSSGGSLLCMSYGMGGAIDWQYSLTYNYEGQGNPGGRVGGSCGNGMWGGGVGGGGAGEMPDGVDVPKDADGNVIFSNDCMPGGIGKVSRITGDAVVYAGGGASGSYAGGDAGASTEVAAVAGGGGASSANASGIFSGAGVDGLGGGGAGGSYYFNGYTVAGTCGVGGKGGRGIVIVRLLGYAASACDHATTEVSRAGQAPTCTEPGWTDEITCTKCHEVIASRAPIAALGHDFDHKYDYQNNVADICTRCHQESRFSKIARLYYSNDRRHIFINAHRAGVYEDVRIPENSVEAVKYAVSQGFEIIEIDPRGTADGMVVLSHDAAPIGRQLYNYTAPHDADNYIVGSGATAKWYGELEDAELRVSESRNEGTGCHMALLSDVLDAAKDNCFVQMDCNPWTANGLLGKIVDMVRERHMEKQCIFFPNQMDGTPPADLTYATGDPFYDTHPTRPYAWGGSLDQNEPEGQNDSSSFPHPDRFGWERLMNDAGTSFMTDKPRELRAYAQQIGRWDPNWKEGEEPDYGTEPAAQSERRIVRMPIPTVKTFIRGRAIKYGIEETDDWEVVRDNEVGGDTERNEYCFVLRLKDPTHTRWANGDFNDPSNDAEKTFWYYAEFLEPDVVDGFPTDYYNFNAAAGDKLPQTGSINGLKWTGAECAYKIGDETVLIFANAAEGAITGFEIENGWDMSGKALLVAGGGPGGANGNRLGTGQPGAGGGAGGMLEGDFKFLPNGTYQVKVGAGGRPTTSRTGYNNVGGDSMIAKLGSTEAAWVEGFTFRAFGGGGGGHANNASESWTDGSKHPDNDLAHGHRGAPGGSSGGTLPYYCFGCNKTISMNDWFASCVKGQGNPGGRIGGYWQNTFCNSSVGGGGASLETTGAQLADDDGVMHPLTLGFGPKIDMIRRDDGGEPTDGVNNRFEGGGKGRASNITGTSVTYAGGGAGGSVYSVSPLKLVKGGMGGGGSTSFKSHTVGGQGIDMLGGGGAGMSYQKNVALKAGNGGSGVVVLRFKMNAISCVHQRDPARYIAKKAPKCVEDGCTGEDWCVKCGRMLSDTTNCVIKAHGHDFTVMKERVEPKLTQDGYILWGCSYEESEGCHETYTEILPMPSGKLPTDASTVSQDIVSGDALGITWDGAAKAWAFDNEGKEETILVFTDVNSSPTFTIEEGATAQVDLLLVGGGGAGGYGLVHPQIAGGVYPGPGGGAGGLVHKTGESLGEGTYTVTVGRGGAIGALWQYGENGGDSAIQKAGVDLYRAIGGGAAGVPACDNKEDFDVRADGKAGGSGGGAASWQDGESGVPGAGTDGQGHAGGAAAISVDANFKCVGVGGGGGAGEAGHIGEADTRWYGGAGGDGIQLNISGLNVWYAGGGAAGSVVGESDSEKLVPGGKGGGGKSYGYQSTRTVENGVDTLGGGGAGTVATQKGGFKASEPGRGGHGVVIVRVTKMTTACAHARTHTTGTDKAATCTEAGSTSGIYCDVCNRQIKKERVLPALGHDFSIEVPGSRVEPTEEADGQVTWTCSREGCGATQVEILKYNLMFEDGETVLWIGDSISDLGMHITDIYRWYLSHEPTRKIRFVNAGISGETAEEALARCREGGVGTLKPSSPYFSDSVVKDFTTAVLMFAINDLGREAYANGTVTEEYKAQKLAAYKQSMSAVVDYLKALPQHPRVIVVTESPYDDTAVGAQFDGWGNVCTNFNASVTEAEQWVCQMAKEKGVKLIDLNTPMNTINHKKQQTDPSYTLIGADRVHPSMTSPGPGVMGRWVMMNEFIRGQKASPVVSDVKVDAAKCEVVKAERAKVTGLTATADEFSFKVKAEALPLAFPRDTMTKQRYNDPDYKIREYSNFEQLAVAGLESGNWTLEISNEDGSWTKIGTYGAAELADGVQLDYLDADSPQLAASRAAFNAALETIRNEAMSKAGVAGAGAGLRENDPKGTREAHFVATAALQQRALELLVERTYRLTKGTGPEPVRPYSYKLPTSYEDATEEFNATEGYRGVVSWAGADRVYAIGDETVLVYTNASAQATFKVESDAVATVDYLLVGGGGAGGSSHFGAGKNLVGGGGGAGGVVTDQSVPLQGGTYTIVVGKGGAANADSNWHSGENGGNTVISLAGEPVGVANGGGAGGCGSGAAANIAGKDGASGGGASWYEGSGDPGANVEGQGNIGGRSTGYGYGGGGGGAGAPGQDSDTVSAVWLGGAGGDGVESQITGEAIDYAGGGAGGSAEWYGTDMGAEKLVQGGHGGGGYSHISASLQIASSGVNGLGGGAGASLKNNATAGQMPGAGGSGCVIIRVRSTTGGDCQHPDRGPYGEDIAPTCETDGQKAGSWCPKCGKIFEDIEVIEKLGHEFDLADGATIIDEQLPTENEDGYQIIQCARCDKTKTITLPRTGGEAKLPTAFTGQSAELEKTGSSDDGIAWSGATRAYVLTNESGAEEKVFIFTNTGVPGTLKISAGKTATVDYLLVAGGGSGGSGHGALAGGGGGAGGVVYAESREFQSGEYAVTVGAGGEPKFDPGFWSQGANGGDSTITWAGQTMLQAKGGGAGSAGSGNGDHASGKDGGSGGGSSSCQQTGVVGTKGTGTDGQGYDGGTSDTNENYAGGGGGAGGAGGDADLAVDPKHGGAGGAGFTSDINGESITYAGGGAGGTVYANADVTVKGGVGGGSSSVTSAGSVVENGVNQLGGGGAGASVYNGAQTEGSRGGDGVVIIRVKSVTGDTPSYTIYINGAPYENLNSLDSAKSGSGVTLGEGMTWDPATRTVNAGLDTYTFKEFYDLTAVPGKDLEFTVELNENARPKFDLEVENPFAVEGGFATFIVSKPYPELYYGVKARGDLTGEFDLIKNEVEGAKLLSGEETLSVPVDTTQAAQFYLMYSDDIQHKNSAK